MSGDPPPGFTRNPGHCPEQAKGKRVRAILANGDECRDEGGTISPHGWAADGQNGCRWARTGSPFDIEWFKVL